MVSEPWKPGCHNDSRGGEGRGRGGGWRAAGEHLFPAGSMFPQVTLFILLVFFSLGSTRPDGSEGHAALQTQIDAHFSSAGGWAANGKSQEGPNK